MGFQPAYWEMTGKMPVPPAIPQGGRLLPPRFSGVAMTFFDCPQLTGGTAFAQKRCRNVASPWTMSVPELEL